MVRLDKLLDAWRADPRVDATVELCAMLHRAATKALPQRILPVELVVGFGREARMRHPHSLPVLVAVADLYLVCGMETLAGETVDVAIGLEGAGDDAALGRLRKRLGRERRTQELASRSAELETLDAPTSPLDPPTEPAGPRGRHPTTLGLPAAKGGPVEPPAPAHPRRTHTLLPGFGAAPPPPAPDARIPIRVPAPSSPPAAVRSAAPPAAAATTATAARAALASSSPFAPAPSLLPPRGDAPPATGAEASRASPSIPPPPRPAELGPPPPPPPVVLGPPPPPPPVVLGPAPPPPVPFATRAGPSAPPSDPGPSTGQRTSAGRPAARRAAARRPGRPAEREPAFPEPLEDPASEADAPTKVTELAPLGPHGLSLEAGSTAPTRGAGAAPVAGTTGGAGEVSVGGDAPPTLSAKSVVARAAALGERIAEDSPTRAASVAKLLGTEETDDAPPTRTQVGAPPQVGAAPPAPPRRGGAASSGLRAGPERPSAGSQRPPPPAARPTEASEPDDDIDAPTRAQVPRLPLATQHDDDTTGVTEVEAAPPPHVRAAASASLVPPLATPSDPETDSPTGVRELAPPADPGPSTFSRVATNVWKDRPRASSPAAVDDDEDASVVTGLRELPPSASLPPTELAPRPEPPRPAARGAQPPPRPIVKGGTFTMQPEQNPVAVLDDDAPSTHVLSPAEAIVAGRVDPLRIERREPVKATLASEKWPAPAPFVAIPKSAAGKAEPSRASLAPVFGPPPTSGPMLALGDSQLSPVFGPPPSSGLVRAGGGVDALPAFTPPPSVVGPGVQLGGLPVLDGGVAGAVMPSFPSIDSVSSGELYFPRAFGESGQHPSAQPGPGAPFAPMQASGGWGAAPDQAMAGPASFEAAPRSGGGTRPWRLYVALGLAAAAVVTLVGYATYLLVVVPTSGAGSGEAAPALPTELADALLRASPSDLARADGWLTRLEADGSAPPLGGARVQHRLLVALEQSDGLEALKAAIDAARARGQAGPELASAELYLASREGDAERVRELVGQHDVALSREPLWLLVRGVELELVADPAAVEKLLAAVALEPRLRPAEVRLVRAQILAGQLDEADRRIAAMPADDPSRRVLEAWSWVKKRLSRGAAGEAPKALPITAEVSRALHPAFLAVSALETRSADRAKLLETAIAQAETPAVALLFGEIALSVGEDPVASVAAKRALALAPGNAGAVSFLGASALATGRLDALESALSGLSAKSALPLRVLVAYERGDRKTLRELVGRLGEDEDPGGLARARLVRIEGQRALPASTLDALSSGAVPGGELVAVDALLDAGEIVRARALVAGWRDPAKHPLQSHRLARLLRYEGKPREASAALSGAPATGKVLIERVLADAEAKGGLDHVLSTIDERVGAARPFLEAYVLARGGDADDAQRRLGSVTPPAFDAELELRLVAVLAYGEAGDDERGAPLLRVLEDSHPKNPDVRRARRALGGRR